MAKNSKGFMQLNLDSYSNRTAGGGGNGVSYFSGSSRDADVSDSDGDSDLTPGSLDVWVDLPDEIKYDPSLAPFKQLYENQRGKIDVPEQNENSDKNLQGQNNKELPTIEESVVAEDARNNNKGPKLMEPLESDEVKKIKSAKQIQLAKGLRILKLTALVAGWLLLTVSLLLNRETSDEVLHTAVEPGVMKDYKLASSNERYKILVTLTGPFSDYTGNTTNKLVVWLQRNIQLNGNEHVQNFTSWEIALPPEDVDFTPSKTKTKKLFLDPLYHSAGEGLRDLKTDSNVTRISLRMSTNSKSTVPITVSIQSNPLDETEGVIYALLLLCILYGLIIFEVVNRTIAALLSSSIGIAVLALSGSRPSLPELMSWMDVETLLLLFSMMLLVAILAETGLFDYLAVVAFELTGGKTWPLITCLCLFTAVFSTFLDNVTTVLLMTPVTIRLCEVMHLNPIPILMSMVIFSNIGGTATPVGDPPNVIIASQPSVLEDNINFTKFTLHMSLGIVLVSIQTYFQLRYMFRDIKKLRHNVPTDIQAMRQEIFVWKRAAASLSSYSRDEDIVRKALEKKVERLNVALIKKEAGKGSSKSDPLFCSTLAQMKEKYGIRNKELLIKSVICVSFVVIVFFLHAIPQLQGLSLGWTALLGALLLLLLAEIEDLEPVLARIEWSTLLFFAALFILMEALSKLGLISWIGHLTESVIMSVGEGQRLLVAIMLVLWVSGLASAFVDNIPLTTMMVRVTAALSDSKDLNLPLAPLIWALSFGACLGGNGTLIGASANVVCAGVAEQHGYRFTFLEFFKIGFPIMIGNLLVATVYLLFCHCLFSWH